MPFLPSGGGGIVTDPDVMKKSVYDIDEDNIVDKSKSLDDGQGNVKTAAEVKNHIDNTSIHPQIDDTTPNTQKVFSSQKVSNELANKSDIGHTHDDRYYTEIETDNLLSGKANINHTHSWSDVDKTGSKLSDIADVDALTPADGQILKWDEVNGKWIVADESGGTVGNVVWADIDKTGSKLSDIADVDTVGLLDGQVLKWSETQQKWIPMDDAVGTESTGSSEVVTKTKWTDYDVANIQRDSDYSFTPLNENLTIHDIFTTGRPLRYKGSGESEWQYGIVLSYSENGSVTISGAPLPSSIYALQYGEPESVIVKNIFIHENPLTMSGEGENLCVAGNPIGSNSAGAPNTNAFDGNFSSYVPLSNGNTIGYSWTDPKIVNKYKIYTTTSGTKYWIFEASNDNSTWVTLDDRSSGVNVVSGWNEFSFVNNTGYKYYRLRNVSSFVTIDVYELEFYYAIEGDKYEITEGKQFVWDYPKAYLVQALGRTRIAPEGADVIVEITKNDLTSYTFQNSLAIPGTDFSSITNSDSTNYMIEKGDRINIQVTQVGSTSAGADLQFQFVFVLDGLDITETLEAPQLLGDSEVFETDTITNTITNYDPLALYSVTFSDPLLSGSILGDTITINAGDIADSQDHIVNMTVTVSKVGYYPNSTTKAITVKYYEGVADDALLISGTTYIADSFDVVNDGTLS